MTKYTMNISNGSDENLSFQLSEEEYDALKLLFFYFKCPCKLIKREFKNYAEKTTKED